MPKVEKKAQLPKKQEVKSHSAPPKPKEAPKKEHKINDKNTKLKALT